MTDSTPITQIPSPAFPENSTEHLLDSPTPETSNPTSLAASSAVLTEIKKAIYGRDDDMSLVLGLYEKGESSAARIHETGVGSNPGAVGNTLLRIKTILGSEWRSTPNQAQAVARTIRRLRRTETFSEDARTYLESLELRLEEFAKDDEAQEAETREAEKESDALEEALEQVDSAIYVYTYPMYYQHPIWEDPSSDHQRYLLKIGMTAGPIGQRITQQTRTFAPEKALVLRAYPTPEPREVEKQFHQALDAAGHTRGNGGREWFSTSLEFCDTIASLLQLRILDGGSKVAPLDE